MNSRCLKLYRAYSISFNSPKVGKFFGIEFYRTVSKFWGKEKESCLVFPSSTKREIRDFHVVFVQRRLRNVQKSVMRVKSYCFANLNPLMFCHSLCRRCPRCLSSLQDNVKMRRKIRFCANPQQLYILGMAMDNRKIVSISITKIFLENPRSKYSTNLNVQK